MENDNVPFQTLSFPATLMGVNHDGSEPWKLVDFIKAFNWLTYEGGKFSTSQGRGVFMDQALEMLPSDCWRWWLLAHAPERGDSDFTWAAFRAGVNQDLADVLGNFVSRVTMFCRSRFGEAVREGGASGAEEQAVAEAIGRRLATLEGHWEALEFRKAAAETRALWVEGNEYLQRAEPWALMKSDPARAAAIVRFSLNLCRLYAIVSRPFIPDTSDTILRAFGIEDQAHDWPDAGRQEFMAALSALPAGHPFAVPDNLFAKITDEAREAMAARFAGAAAA